MGADPAVGSAGEPGRGCCAEVQGAVCCCSAAAAGNSGWKLELVQNLGQLLLSA